MFLFGAGSMLGWSILQAATTEDGVVAFCNAETRALPPGVTRGIDLDDEAAVAALFARERPALIINCAGVCDVDKCEASPEFAHTVNVVGTRHLLAHAPPDARIVHCSSDHVFGGDAGPYREDSPTHPVSVYGRCRVAAEALVLARERTLVVRGGLWIGPSATGRIGHLDWLRDRHRRGLPMTVVADEFRSAVWAADAAARVWAFARSGVTGIRHLTATRAVSRPELAAYLDRRFAIGARFSIVRRDALGVAVRPGEAGPCSEPRGSRRPTHLGRVELATRYTDALAEPLPAVVPAPVS